MAFLGGPWWIDGALHSALTAGVLSFACPVTKEKGTPGAAVGCADFPARLESGGGCGTRRDAAQTVLALFPPASALLGAPHGDPEKRRSFPSFPRKRESRAAGKASGASLGPRLREDDRELRSTGKNREKSETHPHPGPLLEGEGGRAPNPVTLFGAPAAGAEQRRSRRIKGEDCLRGAAPSSAAPAGFEQRRAPGNARRRTGVSFFFGYFLFGQAKRKYARASGAEPSRRIKHKHQAISLRHSRESGNPEQQARPAVDPLDPRLRGDDGKLRSTG